MLRSALLGLAAAAVACGEQDAPLTAQDIDAIQGTLLPMLAATRPTGEPEATRRSLLFETPVHLEVACPVSGHVTARGDVLTACPTTPLYGHCNVGVHVHIDFGREADHFDDCAYRHGLAVHGRLEVALEGSEMAVAGRASGTLETGRSEPAGGRSPLDDCVVSLELESTRRTVSGTVCGRQLHAAW